MKTEDKTNAMQKAWEAKKTEKTLSQSEEELYMSISELYENRLRSCSVRTRNVLLAYQQSFPNKWAYIDHLIHMPKEDFFSLRNAGNKTVDEIYSLSQTILSHLSGDFHLSPHITEPWHMPENIDEALPLFNSSLKGLPKKSRTLMLRLLDKCGNSLSSLYDKISSPGYIESIKRANPKMKKEIILLFDHTFSFFHQFLDKESVSKTVKYSALGLPKECLVFLREKEKSLGYFPLFTSIQLYLEHLTKEEQTLIQDCLLIYQSQKLSKRSGLGSSYKLSAERIRQKRNDLMEKLSDHFKVYSKQGFINKNPYKFQMTRLEDEVNTAEGTNFNLNFVSWVLGSVFDELVVIGDIVKSIGGYHKTEYFLCLVPAVLNSLFDFEAFIKDMEGLIEKKRVNDEEISLKELIRSHLIIENCETAMPGIELTCRTILNRHYPVTFNNGNIILPSNSHKPNQVIIEEILRSTGHQMTFSEILKEFKRLYPGRGANETSLRSSLGLNKNILPIGRSSTYVLSEWEKDELRGGTIRTLVQEFINSIPEKIAPTADVAEYVQRFRPDTNEQSIVDNIYLDPSKTIITYYKEGVRYFGFADRLYPLEYFPFESSGKTARVNSINYPRLLSFIQTNRHFPRYSGITEEESLYQFWRTQELRYKSKKMDGHALIYYTIINVKFKHLK